MVATIRALALLPPALLLLSACKPAPQEYTAPPPVVEVMTLTNDEQSMMRSFNGMVVPAEMTPLSFRLDGEIAVVAVKAGQAVAKGALLAKLDDRKIKQQLEEAESRFALADRQLQRAQGLVQRELLSQAEFDQLSANRELTRVNLQAVKRQLAYTELRAPFAGMVAAVPKEDYESVSPGDTVVSLYRNDLVYVRVPLPNELLAQLLPNQDHHNYQPIANFYETGARFPMRYLEHTGEPLPETGAYEVWLTMPQPSPAILPGSVVTLEVDLVKAGFRGMSGFRVPLSALDPGNISNEFFIWTVDEGRAQRRPVQIESLRAGVALVSGPIAAGDQVITSNVSRLRSGEQVMLYQPEAAQ